MCHPVLKEMGVDPSLNRKRTVKPYIIGSAALAATSFFLLGSSNVIGIHLGHSIYLVTAALCLNGIGIGGEQGRLNKYRVGHLLADLGWVDLDLECSTIMLGQ